jgi:hypothetical protein
MSTQPLLTSIEISNLFPLDQHYVVYADIHPSFPYHGKNLKGLTMDTAVKVCQWFLNHKDDLELVFEAHTTAVSLAAEQYPIWIQKKPQKKIQQPGFCCYL